MIDLSSIDRVSLETEPWEWAFVGELFRPGDAAELARTFPNDHYKTVAGYDGEKGYEYESRELVAMGARTASRPEELAPAWLQLASDLVSPAYKASISQLIDRDVSELAIEVNIFHYTPGAWLGPHVDLKDKLVTHVLYFNDRWNLEDGGCLSVLAAKDMSSAARVILPVVGNSALLVRSDRSWHAVSKVSPACTTSRRSMTVTFYKPGSISTMWPPNDVTPLHRYAGEAR